MDTEVHDETTADTQKSGLSGFLQSLAGYYSQFLETDFKGTREPKRRFTERNGNNRVGIQLVRYPQFRSLIINKLKQQTPASFQVKYGRYTARLSKTVSVGIESAIKSADTSALAATCEKIVGECESKTISDNFDFETFVEAIEGTLYKAFDDRVVSRVLNVIKPVLQGQSGASAALEDIDTFSDEIVELLLNEQRTSLAESIGEGIYQKQFTDLQAVLAIISDENRIKQCLSDYFEEFAAQDVFVELRELYGTLALCENTQIYLNVGEIIVGRSKFPLYYIPVELSMQGDAIRLEFSASIYANKKAIDFVLSYLKREHKVVATNPIVERIFHKDPDESYIDTIYQTFHKAVAATKVEGDVDIAAEGLTKAKGHGITVSNDITFSLFDKSDESIVNDYEALMVGLADDSPLLAAFRQIVESFLTENPLSIDADIEVEWDETPTPERLVFQSPLPLAEEQRKVLSAIRHPDSRFIIVEGPPGTGKSHTISAIAFELILKGKNVLVLSDKKEALDVVEGKLNDVITKVRGDETEYVNPILRLGKTDSNYSNIIKRASIDKLKTSVRTFKASEENFTRQFSSLESGLKEKVLETVKTSQNITFEEIHEFHEAEYELLESFPELKETNENDDRQILLLSKIYSLVTEDRQKYAQIGKDSEELNEYLRLLPALRTVPDEITKQSEHYPDLKLQEAERLHGLVAAVQTLRKPLFGYLFSGSALLEMSSKIEEITGVFEPKPQSILAELSALARIPKILKSAISSFGFTSDHDAETVYRLLRIGAPIGKDDATLLKKLTNTEISPSIKSLLPYTINGLLGCDDNAINILQNFGMLMERKQLLREKFEQIPDFDYLQEKSQLEQMSTLKLVAQIDERVTDFAIHKRADARTLQQIIRAKAKFPVDKFGVLREAFPCMIAGLRDFAEFIPLESDLFDLVVIDEASQVSIAQALPAILRAKKVLVLGDRKQFGNVKTANASKQINQGYFKEVMDTFEAEIGDDVSQKIRAKNFNVTHSVMDFFELTSNFTIQLKKHFRGYPEMISFSSKYVYQDGLQALKIRGKPVTDVLEFVETPEPDRLEITRNANVGEAKLIIERLEGFLDLDEPPSVAIITPHREQVTYIQKCLSEHPEREALFKQLKLAVFTFDTCQGEERDVIFYSMVGTRQLDNLKYIFPRDLTVSEDEVDGNLKFQRLNVGFSRGKEKLVFVLSKPIAEYQGAIQRVLQHYQTVLGSAQELPDAADTDQSSPMEAQVLEWLKSTHFVTSNFDSIEIIPQFELGDYLKALNPTYSHPAYKVDFLIRLTTETSVQQCIIEYDGFEYHFDNRSAVDAGNWRNYLTDGDVEREFVLESFGYKMLRINRFNVGKDPVAKLDMRLSELFKEFSAANDDHEVISNHQAAAAANIEGLESGTHKKCSKCDMIKTIDAFADNSLKSGYGNHCIDCKISSGRAPHRRKTY